MTTTTGLILAGGAGRRTGGRDKGLILWRGRPLVEYVAAKLRPQVDRLLVSCNRNFDQYATIAEQTIADSRGEYQGPLAGLEAARAYIDTEYLIVSPCDTPMLPDDLVPRLMPPLLRRDARHFDISYAHDGERGQYLCAALRSSCLASLSEYLDEGQRAVRHWYQRQRCIAVDFSDKPACFSNYNFAEDKPGRD